MEKTEFTQARKKTELLYMLEMMMRNPEAPEEKRNNLKIYIINVDQGPNSCLYTTKTNVARQTHEWLATANSIFFYFLSF